MNAKNTRNSPRATQPVSRHVARFLALSAVALSVPMTVLAAATDGATPDQSRPAASMDDWGGPHHHGHHDRHGGREGFGGPGMMMLHGLDLTEAQRTQVKTLMDAQRQAFADKAKAMHDARVELAKLAMSDAYNARKAGDLATSLAQKESDLAKLMAEQGNKVYQILTPEQRTKLQQRLDRFAEHRPFMAPPAPASAPAK